MMHARYPAAVIVHYDNAPRSTITPTPDGYTAHEWAAVERFARLFNGDAPPITITPAHNIAAELDAALALYDRVFLDEGGTYTSESLCRTSQAREILHKMRVALLA
jgi:hypothetical protein